ncbi:MAG: TetR/AcrR family transcriptional regulator [Acidobacteria bacterium]|nr:TetR/AcrR family transcriptional regulator [Acidobacteriota bacterium]
MKNMNSTLATAERIMDAAQRMVQTRGYNAFSYADISAQVGIRKASIHYYFPSKKDLGKELVARYRVAFRDKLDRIDNETNDARRKLKAYAQLYLEALRDDDRMCLCGMLASDITTLPEEVRREVVSFFADNETWLMKTLGDGRNVGVLSFSGSAKSEAQLLLTGLQGAMLVARTYGDEARFRTVVRSLLARIVE